MRQTICFNDNWQFSKDRIHQETVNLPHTWNAIDGMDGKGEYDRGEYYYTKQFPTPTLRDGERVDRKSVV